MANNIFRNAFKPVTFFSHFTFFRKYNTFQVTEINITFVALITRGMCIHSLVYGQADG